MAILDTIAAILKHDCLQQDMILEEETIFQEVIQTPEFQRLKGISFLGILDYYFYSGNNEKSTRYDHSLAVAELCLKYSRNKNLTESEVIYFVLAGLLHDLGHCGFSHSLESVFQEKFGFSHHDVTKTLITNSPNLIEIWLKHDIDPIKIVDAIEGDPTLGASVIAEMAINFDTLDGIVRTERSFSNNDRSSSTRDRVFHILCSLDDWHNHTTELDPFWVMKNEIYDSFIYDNKFRVIELAFQTLFKEISALAEDDFYLTDAQFFNKFSWMREFIDRSRNFINDHYAMTNSGKGRLLRSFKERIRNFFINSEGDFGVNNNERYLVRFEEREYHLEDLYGPAIF